MLMTTLMVEYNKANCFPSKIVVEVVTSEKLFIILPPSSRDSNAGDPDATSDLYKLLRNSGGALESPGTEC